jgi:hypothetical protein
MQKAVAEKARYEAPFRHWLTVSLHDCFKV